jgi:ribonuclease H2 subunit A
VYVDALGTTTTYETYLSSLFPGINFTVTTKADSKYKIVGAASVAAKVTRDACLEGWVFEESDCTTSGHDETRAKPWSTELGSGYPSGPCSSPVYLYSIYHDMLFGRPKNTSVAEELS